MSSRFAFTSLRNHRAVRWLVVVALAVGSSGVSACQARRASSSTLVLDAPQADADADVFVDGTYVGRLGEIGKGDLPPIKLGPGVHRLEVRKSGRFPVQRTIRVDKDAPAEIVVDAELLEDPS